MEPGSEGGDVADGAGAEGEGEEGGLEGIIGGVGVGEDAFAGGEDHGAMAKDEGFEGGVIPAGEEAGEEDGISTGEGGFPAPEACEGRGGCFCRGIVEPRGISRGHDESHRGRVVGVSFRGREARDPEVGYRNLPETLKCYDGWGFEHGFRG
jgi:hypothetical protein